MSTKRKFPQKLGQPMVKQSAKPIGKTIVDESKTMVSGGGRSSRPNLNGFTGETINISSDSSSEEEEDGEGADSQDEGADEQSVAEADTTMNDAEPALEVAIREEDADEAGETGEPSFGDLVRANASEHIDVAGAFDDPSSRALSHPRSLQLQIPTGASLGTVLSQALKTNDVSLLESCLHTTDLNTVRATIQRLDSPLAGTLLQKLAERLHRRPGRAGSLMVWVQWTLITHGGYLATQPNLVKKLSELNKVIEERAKGLQSLLLLKGKLDMLESQMELRRSMQNQRRRIDDDEDDEEGVIYVEGQESEDDEPTTLKPQRLATNGDLNDISDADSDISDEMPTTNGVAADSDEEDEESSEDGDLIDDEAEESDAETGDEDKVDHADLDSQDDDDDSDDAHAAPPRKLPRTAAGAFSKRR